MYILYIKRTTTGVKGIRAETRYVLVRTRHYSTVPPPLCVADYNDNAFVIINILFVLFSKSQQVGTVFKEFSTGPP